MKVPRSMNLLVVGGVFLAAMGAYAGGDGGNSNSFKGRLSGNQEVPAVSTTGEGEFRARLRDNPQRLDYSLSYNGLEGTTTLAAHIHIGQMTANGGVSAFLCGGAGKPPCPPTGGTVEGSITAADVIGPAGQGVAAGEFAELIEMMREGDTYANVHTNKHPGGEIRGQIKRGGGNGDDD